MEIKASETGLRSWQDANISESDASRIQNAANRTGIEINVVGSRANGTARVNSNWDYVINANSKIRNSLSRSLPGAGDLSEGIRSNIDIFRDELDPSNPYVTFKPEN